MLGRWDPFAELSRLQSDFARVAGASRPAAVAFGAAPRESDLAFHPAVNIYEAKDAILVKVELPGVKAEDINVHVENNVLTVSGERRLEKEEDKDGWHRPSGAEGVRVLLETAYGAFSRSFALPSSVDSAGIEASMDAGILTLRVPKRMEAQARTIKIGTKTPDKTEKLEAKKNGTEARA